MKRSVVLTLCMIVCLALSLGGTIAYLTDSDGDVNVMTLGRVEIALEEYQRDESRKLEAYENDRMLHPLVGAVDEGKGEFGLPTNVNFHDKIVRVTSKSSNANAYLRVWIGVPSALLNVNGVADQDAVHLVLGERVTVTGEGIAAATVDGWPWRHLRTENTTIEAIPYTMFCYEYTQILKPGDVTPPVLAGLYLDEHVDNDDNGAYTYMVAGTEYPLNVDFTSGLQIPVLAQAVQADGFTSAEQAFEAANMNDNNLFDEYLELKKPLEKLTAEVERLINELSGVMKTEPEQYEAYRVELTSDTYVINDLAAQKLNEEAEKAAYDQNGNDTWQKDVMLEVGENKQVNIILQNNNVELTDNVVIVNSGGELIISGN